MTIHLGITGWTGRSGWRANAIAEQAAKAEALGYSSYWLPENHLGDARSIPAPLLLLAAAAAKTQRIQLATTSYLLPIRDPILAAEEIAVLDQLCDGRLLLGRGRGIQRDLFELMGIDPADKRRLFAEKLTRIRDALDGKPLSESGATLGPLPVQPSIPLWVAAFGPLAQKQAGALGFPYLASPRESLAALSDNYRRHADAVAEAGLTAVDTVPVMRVVVLARDETDAAKLRGTLAQAAPPANAAPSVALDDWALVGTADTVSGLLADYQRTLGLTHLTAIVRTRGISDAQAEFTFRELPAVIASHNG